MMLGVSNSGNNWKIIVANFVLTFTVQVVWLLYELLPDMPCPMECYGIVVKSVALTLAFYGLNKVVTKKYE